ncbi:MAG: hypothetical protein HPY66_3221 [Firmicutes bacterium]|nr:hypothetical protein [Bacillota bacterium]
MLKPLDKENVLNAALHILFEQGKGYMAEDILAQVSVKLTHATMHILSLCNIQARELSKAEIEIQKAIADFPNSPVYHLVAGLIDYWRAIPEDISDAKGIIPVFVRTDSFVPTAEQTEHLEAALKHYGRARELTASYSNRLILSEISQAWILTACLLPYKKKDADRAALEMLKCDPDNSVILLYAAEQKLELNDECIVKLKRLVEEGKANPNHYYWK